MRQSRIDPSRLEQALLRNGWTYMHAAREVRKHLPDDSKFSHVSVWSYATGRAVPKRVSYIEAIEAAFGVPPGGLSASAEPPSDRSPSASDPSDGAPLGQDRPAAAPGGVAAAASPGSPLALAVAADGKVQLKIDAKVSWQAALGILEIMRSEGGAESETLDEAASGARTKP